MPKATDLKLDESNEFCCPRCGAQRFYKTATGTRKVLFDATGDTLFESVPLYDHWEIEGTSDMKCESCDSVVTVPEGVKTLTEQSDDY